MFLPLSKNISHISDNSSSLYNVKSKSFYDMKVTNSKGNKY
jgi:hypothetical protein